MPRNTPRMRGCTSMQKKLVLQKHQEMKRGRFLIGIFSYLNYDNNLHHELDRAVAEGLPDGFKDALAVPNEESVRKEVLPEVDS